MNESKTTFIFVGVAAVMALAAFGSQFLNQPSNSSDFELVGKPFFEDFTSASQAQSLEVAAVDAESARLKRFGVENQDGLWRIPSHYDYPAEAAARLATTASSVMGITRDSLAGRRKKEHERLGVLDPLADDIEDPEGVGKRITFKDASGEVVVDYIIGKEAGEVVLSESEQPFGGNRDQKYYYIRRADEDQAYKVKLDLDLSTKFSDWIDPDLLRVDSNEVTKISIDNYTLEEDRSNPLAQTKALFKAQGDKLEISRKSNTEPWELIGLETDEEVLETSRIDEMLQIFDEMKIAGVRPKYKYKDHLLLTSDLQLNQQPEFEKNPQEFGRAINRLQTELDQKGFNLAGSAQKMELVAQSGDLEIGTDKGVMYTLHVGRAFEGDEEAIEIGSTSESETDSNVEEEKANAEPAESESETPATAKNTESVDGEDAKEKADEAKNRYLMVRVSFDESLITPKPVQPVAPVEPVKPEGWTPPPAEAEKTDEAVTDESGEDPAEKPPGEQELERNPEFVKYDEAIKAFHDQKIDFELATTRFTSEQEAFQAKVTEGKELVKELNERFGDWYYVITGDNLNTLQTERTDLVKAKEIPPGEAAAPQRPDISFPDLPTVIPGIKPDPAKQSDTDSTEGLKGEVKKDPAADSAEDPKSAKKEESKGDSKDGLDTINKNESGIVDPTAKKTELTEPSEKESGSEPSKQESESGPDQGKGSSGNEK